MNTFLALLVVASAGGGTIGTLPLESLKAAPAPTMVTPWDAVHDYIVAHATQTDATTEALLQAEAEAGVTTWTVFSGSSSVNMSPNSPLDGPGLGWPAASHVITFATEEETLIAAGMILTVTAGQPAPAGLHRSPVAEPLSGTR